MVAEIVDMEKPVRKLVTVRRIKALDPIPGADAIVVATVDGWKVVVKKDEFKVGDQVIYFEIDSFLPTGNPAWQFLVDKQGRTFNETFGHRLRTVKLRGQVSQGFVLPVTAKLQQEWAHSFNLEYDGDRTLQDGDDVTDVLGIVKWEAPIPAELVGQVKGFFPSFIRKTDQERCQNFEKEIFEDNKGAHYEVTMKLDGMSVTYYFYNGEVGVCSRNLELKINEANAGNSLVRMLLDSGLYDALMKLGHPVAIQGELMGPGIQGNREQFKEHKFFVFDVQALDAGIYLTPDERTMLVSNLIFNYGVKPQMVQHVPIVAHTPELYDSLGISSVAGLLHFAEGPSINHPVREGLVFKRVDGKFSFKAISNKFLEKEKD